MLCHLIISSYLLPFCGGGQSTFENTLFFLCKQEQTSSGNIKNNLLLILPGSKSKKFLCCCQTLLSIQNPEQLASMSFTGLWGITPFSVFVCACALVCVVFSRCTMHKVCNFPCQCFSKLKRILIMSHLRLFLVAKLLTCLLIRNSESAVQFPWVSTSPSPNLLNKK